MSLLNDGPPSGMVDLMAQDSQVMDVAVQENIDVSGKLALAQEEVRLEVKSMLDSLTSTTGLIGTYQGLWAGVPPGVGNVAVTPALKLWHTYRTLFLIYSDAYYSQLNDRYAGRRDEYREMAKWGRERLIQTGIGMVADPIPVAMAPGVSESGGTLTAGTYYVGISWASGRGQEGACSLPASISTSGGAIVVTPGDAPSNAAGWHVYVGTAPDTMVRQNGAVLPLGSTWTLVAVASSGVAAGRGQALEFVLEAARVIQRG